MISIVIMALLFTALGMGVLIGLIVWADNIDKRFESERRKRHEDGQQSL